MRGANYGASVSPDVLAEFRLAAKTEISPRVIRSSSRLICCTWTRTARAATFPPFPPAPGFIPGSSPPPLSSLGVHALGRPRIRTRARRHGVPRLSRLSHCRGTSAFEIDESSSEMRVHRARPAESIESIFPKSRRHRRRRRHSPGVSPRLRVRSQRAEDDPRGQRRRRRRRRDREDSKTRRMRPRDSRWMRIKICALYELISSSSEQERERRVLGCDN